MIPLAILEIAQPATSLQSSSTHATAKFSGGRGVAMSILEQEITCLQAPTNSNNQYIIVRNQRSEGAFAVAGCFESKAWLVFPGMLCTLRDL